MEEVSIVEVLKLVRDMFENFEKYGIKEKDECRRGEKVVEMLRKMMEEGKVVGFFL